MMEKEFVKPLLINAPLKEVIFEMQWDLDYIPEQNLTIDTGFDTAKLDFRSSIIQEFKYVETLIPPAIPDIAFNKKVTHQFYREKDTYPIYQFGPGVFTVNDNNKNYSWVEFKRLILDGVKKLKDSYKKDLVLNKIELRYIDAVNINALGETDKFEFLRKNLQVNPEPYPFVNGTLEGINFSKKFMIDAETSLNIIVATANDINTNTEIALWHTFLNNRKRLNFDTIEAWIDKAHTIASETFTKMISKELYEYFNK